VIDMVWMFYGPSSFNKDLTKWCVTNIPVEPSNFSFYTLTAANKPIWGICPG
jgi:hypothetical protein